MSATPASASLPPGLTAIAAKLFPGSTATDAASIDANGADLFAAHFQRLLGKQLAVEVDVGQMPDTIAASDAPSNELSALLPFIEALGLTQTAVATPISDTPVEQATEPEIAGLGPDAATVPLAVPATTQTANVSHETPAISAAKPSPQGLALGQAFQAPTQAVASETPEALTSIIASGEAPVSAEELSAGREFSAQLVAAIAASKEAQHAPGTTAAAVQNIVSQAAPGKAMHHEAAPVISQAVGAPGWTEELGNHVTWLANRSESRAELVLTPPQMGRIEVNLSIKGDQATASFASSNPVVREALEAALPRLREVLADAGIQLGQAQVNAENARQWAQQEKHGDNSGSDPTRATPVHEALSSASSGSLSTSSGLKGGRSLVDVFA